MVLGSTSRAYHLPQGVYISCLGTPSWLRSVLLSHTKCILCQEGLKERGVQWESRWRILYELYLSFPIVYPVPIEIPDPRRCSVGCLFNLQMEILLLCPPGSQAIITLLSKARSWCNVFLFFSVWMLLCDSQRFYIQNLIKCLKCMIFIGLNNNLFMICVAFSLFLRALYIGFSNRVSVTGIKCGPLAWLCQNTPPSINTIFWFSSYVPFAAFHLGLIQTAFLFHPKSYLTCRLNEYEQLHITNLYLAVRYPTDRGAWWFTSCGVTKS